jgi:hypothetical protein
MFAWINWEWLQCSEVETEISGFQVLTVTSMKMAVFWDVAPCR